MNVYAMTHKKEKIWETFKFLNNSINMFKNAINKNIDQNIMANVRTSALVAITSLEEP